MILAVELALKLEGCGLELIRRALQRVAGSRMNSGVDAVGADRSGIAVPSLFVSDPPIRRESVDNVALSAVKRVGASHYRRGVAAEFGVEMTVQPDIRAQPRNASGQVAVYLSGCARSGSDTGAGKGKSPGRSGVPRVFDCWI